MPNSLRDEKVKVLRAIAMEPGEVMTDVVRGQYGPGWVAATKVPGYREEPDVDPHSETETFVAAKLQIDDWRWSGVPFYVRTGKRLPKRATEIAIQYREVPHRLFRDAAVGPGPEPAGHPRSSRTRGSCCGSGPRSRGSAWTSAR